MPSSRIDSPSWMSLLNGISYVINASAEARKCFGDFILDFVKRSCSEGRSDCPSLGSLIDIGSRLHFPSYKDEIEIDGDVDIVIGVTVKFCLLPHSSASRKRRDPDIILPIKSILSYFTWLRPTTNTDLVSLNDYEKVLAHANVKLWVIGDQNRG
jgi:hypothetical protein